MNNGFTYYFRNGLSNAFHALKGESLGKRFSLLVYFVMSFIGKLIIFTRPIFAIADMNLASMIRECQTFSFAKIFQNTSDGKRYKNLLLYYFLFDLALLVALMILAIPAIALWFLVSYMASIRDYSYVYATVFYITLVFTIAIAVLFILLLTAIVVTYSPVKYIAANSRDCDVSDYLYNARKCMKGHKWTEFFINLVYLLIITLLIGIIAGSIICLFIYSDYFIGILLSLLIFMLSSFLFIYVIQIFFLARLNANYLLFKYTTSLDRVLVVKQALEDEDKIETVLDENTEESEETIEEDEVEE